LTDCVVVDPSVSWNDVVNGFKGGMNNKSLKSALCRLSLGVAMYHLWKQRNDLPLSLVCSVFLSCCILTLQFVVLSRGLS
jgi:hypothetical protein